MKQQDEAIEKTLRKTMLKAVSYIDLDKVRDTEEEISKDYPIVSKQFYTNFIKTISSKDTLRNFIKNITPNENNYDNMVILHRLAFGLDINKPNEISAKTAFLEWIDFFANDIKLRRDANVDLMGFYSLKLGKFELAIKHAENLISMETDAMCQIFGRNTVLQSLYALIGNTDLLNPVLIPDKSTTVFQYANKGIKQAEETLSFLESIDISKIKDFDCKKFRQRVHTYRCKFALFLRSWDTNNYKINAIVDEYRNGNYFENNKAFNDELKLVIKQFDKLLNLRFSEEPENPIQWAWQNSYEHTIETFPYYSKNYHMRDQLIQFSYKNYYFFGTNTKR